MLLIIRQAGVEDRAIEMPPGLYVLGRHPDCDLVIDSMSVSRQHARVELTEREFGIEDLGSTSGTFVRGEILTRPNRFPIPCVVQVGAVTVEFGGLASAAIATPIQAFTPHVQVAENAPALEPSKPALDRMSDPTLDKAHEHYDIGEEIARGGMGAILKAQDTSLKRTVALKTMLPATGDNPSMRERFIREAAVLARLEHPNIVPLHELGRDPDGRLFYTMKLVKGRTLQAILDDLADRNPEALKEFTLNRLLGIFRRVCEALSFAHAQGVIHRDLKPENVMVGEFGEVLVMDWGLARIMDDDSQSRTEAARGNPGLVVNDVEGFQELSDSEYGSGSAAVTVDGTVFGSPQYMPPEQAEGRVAEIDERSDIFSLGGILYAILTLKPPVEGRTVREVLDNVKSGRIHPPTHFNTGTSILRRGQQLARGEIHRIAGSEQLPHCPGGRVPAALSSVTMRALSTNPEDRYQSAHLLNADVEAWLNGFTTLAESAGPVRRTLLWVMRNRALAGATVVVLFVMAFALTHAWRAYATTEASVNQLRGSLPLIEEDVTALINRGELAQALQRIDQILPLVSDRPDLLKLKGDLLQIQGKWDASLAAYQQVLDMGGFHPGMEASIEQSRKMKSAKGVEDFTAFIKFLKQQQRFAEAEAAVNARVQEIGKKLGDQTLSLDPAVKEREGLLRKAVAGLAKGNPVSQPSPVCRWDFEVGLKDSVLGQSLELDAGAYLKNGRLELDSPGATAQVYVTNSPRFLERSVEIWVMPHGPADQIAEPVILRNRSKPELYEGVIYGRPSPGMWHAFGADEQGGSSLTYGRYRSGAPVSSTTTSPGQLRHVVLTQQPGTGALLYVDGRLERKLEFVPAREAYYPEIAPGELFLRLGRRFISGAAYSFQGAFEEVAVYDKTLSPEEVAALYANNPLHWPKENLRHQLEAGDQDRLAVLDLKLAAAEGLKAELRAVQSLNQRGELLAHYKQLLTLRGLPDAQARQMTFSQDGRLQLIPGKALTADQLNSMRGMPFSAVLIGGRDPVDVRLLKAMPLSRLLIQGEWLMDLTFLQGMALKEFSANGCPVRRLDPLTNMPLASLVLNDTRVAELPRMQMRTLTRLEVKGTQVEDLSPMAGQPLLTLLAANTQVQDLSPLRGMSIRVLNLHGSPVTDLSPLAGMPLEILTLHGCPDEIDLSPLAQCSRLRQLTIPAGANPDALRGLTNLARLGTDLPGDQWQKVGPPSTFWRERDKARGKENAQ